MSAGSYIKDRRIITLIAVVLVLVALDLVYGLHFGIEFVGGTQIPVTLEHSVNITTMSTLISALSQRLDTFGLQQVTIEGIGTSQLYVIIPTSATSSVNQTVSIIQAQGRFDGVVNGQQALNGSSVIRDSIGVVPAQEYNNTVTWQVDFFVTQQGQNLFAKAALGQANKPLYMFLDRPLSAVILVNQSELAVPSQSVSAATALSAMQSALIYQPNQTIPVVTVSNNNASIASAESFFTTNKGKYSTVLASSDINQTLISFIKGENYTVKLESRANMTPTYIQVSANSSIIETWPLVGLISSPTLAPGVTNGNTSSSYEISGAVPLTVAPQNRLNYANNQSKTIASVLSGGALPVAVIAGTPTTIPPTLGAHFLYISGIAGLIAIVFVSLFIVARYRKIFLVAPILLTTAMELFIIVSIIGLVGTIDLAAVAGMIAVIGTGVDAQVIITDEILNRRSDSSGSVLLGNAFYIVWTDAALLVIAMLPLFFSTSLVDVIGFSEATIFGALLSVFITRPAYGAIISRRYS